MNLNDPKYTPFGLVRDMLQTAEVVDQFDADQAKETGKSIAKIGRLLLTGEGSSRIFPAKNALAAARRLNYPLALHTEAARQAQEYDLSNWAVFAASNSGKTAEVIKLFTHLRSKDHKNLFGLTATAQSRLEEIADKTYVLKCGPEGAVAATKSVIEQALFYQAMLEHACGIPLLGKRCRQLCSDITTALELPIDPNITEMIANAGTIYFAGRSDGVAEELTLKTNEITRKKSDYLEGTYAVHGIEEVMNADDVLIWIDPYEDSQEKFQAVLSAGVGMSVIAIASRATAFPTIRIPHSELATYTQLAAGWNLLVEVGIKLGINLDKPLRARKVGNEFTG
jgi:glucosamine--fructose-6-phosphate aminotransferase (isomerizing)